MSGQANTFIYLDLVVIIAGSITCVIGQPYIAVLASHTVI